MKPKLNIILTLLLAAHADQMTAQNLVTNGDFEGGNTGFTTEYINSPMNLFPARTYGILTNPRSAHASFAVMGDHTSGTGNMMVVNGATASSPVVWAQEVNVQSNRVYFFSTWAANVLGGTPSRFVFRINGVTLEPQVILPSQAAVWQNYTTTWGSESSTSALLEIIFVSTEFNGNDSALDDVLFREASLEPVQVSISKINQSVSLEWNSILGVDYQLQSSIELAAWINVGAPLPGDDTTMSHSEPISQPKKFFRVIGLKQ